MLLALQVLSIGNRVRNSTSRAWSSKGSTKALTRLEAKAKKKSNFTGQKPRKILRSGAEEEGAESILQAKYQNSKRFVMPETKKCLGRQGC